MAIFTEITSAIIPLLVDDIDTDQIIPARFLKVTDKKGIGRNLFADWRYNADGSPRPEFILNTPQASGRQILLTGHNFGCGSSREHAPWALFDFGFRVILSTSFADIFRNNALKNGLLPVALEQSVHERICSLVSSRPESTLTVDLRAQQVTLPDGAITGFTVDAFARTCLLNGVDELGYIRGFEENILAFEKEEV